MDGSVVIGVDFKYLPPTRLLCNDENVEMRLMSAGLASMMSRSTKQEEEREKSVIVSGGGGVESVLGEIVQGPRGNEKEVIAPVTPPNTPNNGMVSPVLAVKVRFLG